MRGLGAHAGLVRAAAEADGSGAHGEAAGPDASLAQRNRVVSRELLRESDSLEARKVAATALLLSRRNHDGS